MQKLNAGLLNAAAKCYLKQDFKNLLIVMHIGKLIIMKLSWFSTNFSSDPSLGSSYLFQEI